MFRHDVKTGMVFGQLTVLAVDKDLIASNRLGGEYFVCTVRCSCGLTFTVSPKHLKGKRFACRDCERKIEQKSSSNLSGQPEKGSVVYYDTSKGFGFLRRDCGGDVFCPYASVKQAQPLVNDQRVEFVTVQSSRGLRAENVRAI